MTAARFFGLALPAVKSPACRELDELLLSWLREQYESVTLAQICSPPKGTALAMGDVAEVGGLGTSKGPVRLALQRLEQEGKVLRLEPPRGSCAPLYVAAV